MFMQIINIPCDYYTHHVTEKHQKTTAKIVLFVSLICIFYFLYCGAELITAAYLTTFSVKSRREAVDNDILDCSEYIL
jgi:hypothetical protein